MLTFGAVGKSKFCEASRHLEHDRERSRRDIEEIIQKTQEAQRALDQLRKRSNAAVAVMAHTKTDMQNITAVKRNMQAFEESLWQNMWKLNETVCILPSWNKLLDERSLYWFPAGGV